jgi:hypothetical protein
MGINMRIISMNPGRASQEYAAQYIPDGGQIGADVAIDGKDGLGHFHSNHYGPTPQPGFSISRG